MTLRKGLLWLMLVSLGLSAVGGALAVLTASADIIWRIVATGLATAVSAGLLLAISLLLDKPKSRPTGLLGMCAVILAFALTLALLWNFTQLIAVNGRSEWKIALMLLAVFLTAPPAMLFLAWTYSPNGKWSGMVGVAACGAAFVTMLAGSWWEPVSFPSLGEKLWDTAFIVGGGGVLASASLAGWGANARPLRVLGVLTSAAAATLALIGVWADAHGGAAALITVTGLAVILGHGNLTFMCPLKTGQQWVRIVTLAAVVICATMLDISAWQSRDMDWELVNRGAGAAGVVAACGSLALLILARLNRRMISATAPPNVKELSITCPWCQRRQSLPLGDSSCAGCGLKFKIDVEEPRCPTCDYLLYMLQSDRCPECGTPVGAKTLTV